MSNIQHDCTNTTKAERFQPLLQARQWAGKTVWTPWRQTLAICLQHDNEKQQRKNGSHTETEIASETNKVPGHFTVHKHTYSYKAKGHHATSNSRVTNKQLANLHLA